MAPVATPSPLAAGPLSLNRREAAALFLARAAVLLLRGLVLAALALPPAAALLYLVRRLLG